MDYLGSEHEEHGYGSGKLGAQEAQQILDIRPGVREDEKAERKSCNLYFNSFDDAWGFYISENEKSY